MQMPQQFAAPRRLGQPGTPVDLTILFWGVSLLAVGAFLLGGGEPSRPLRRKRSKAARDGGRAPAPAAADGGVKADAVSALKNLGYSKADAASAVATATRKGARGFDAIMRESLQVLG